MFPNLENVLKFRKELKTNENKNPEKLRKATLNSKFNVAYERKIV